MNSSFWIALAIIIIIILVWFLKVSCNIINEKSAKIKEHEEAIKSREAEIGSLRNRVDYFRSQYNRAAEESHRLKDEHEFYKMLLNKYIGDGTKTDDFFMYESRTYQPVEFTMDDAPGSSRSLRVIFQEATLCLK